MKKPTVLYGRQAMDAETKRIVDADFSMVEERLMAHYSSRNDFADAFAYAMASTTDHPNCRCSWLPMNTVTLSKEEYHDCTEAPRTAIQDGRKKDASDPEA